MIKLKTILEYLEDHYRSILIGYAISFSIISILFVYFGVIFGTWGLYMLSLLLGLLFGILWYRSPKIKFPYFERPVIFFVVSILTCLFLTFIISRVDGVFEKVIIILRSYSFGFLFFIGGLFTAINFFQSKKEFPDDGSKVFDDRLET